MNAIDIQRRHRVRADAEHWRSADGRSLRECVGEWLELQLQLERLLEEPPAPLTLLTGDACGWIEQHQGQRCDILLTQAAVTACIGEVGLECSTPAGLHHVLFDLVEEGCVAAAADRCLLPDLGGVLIYRFHAQQFGICGHVAARRARDA